MRAGALARRPAGLLAGRPAGPITVKPWPAHARREVHYAAPGKSKRTSRTLARSLWPFSARVVTKNSEKSLASGPRTASHIVLSMAPGKAHSDARAQELCREGG